MVERTSGAAVPGSSFPSLQQPLAEPHGRDGRPGERHDELPSRVATEGFGASENVAQRDRDQRPHVSWRCSSSEEEAARPPARAVGTAFPPLALPQVSQLTSGKRLRNSDSSAPPDSPGSQRGVTWLAELPPSFSPSPPNLSHHHQTGAVPLRPAEGSTRITSVFPGCEGFPALRCGLAQRAKGL